jgi:hypothetical protein
VGDLARIAYEMTISQADFLRTLPAVMQGKSYTVNGREIKAQDGECRILIRLSEPSQRHFGPIALAVTHVELIFEGYDPTEVERFKTRFDNCYRRGGG